MRKHSQQEYVPKMPHTTIRMTPEVRRLLRRAWSTGGEGTVCDFIRECIVRAWPLIRLDRARKGIILPPLHDPPSSPPAQADGPAPDPTAIIADDPL